MWNVIMTVTCLLNNANMDLSFEVNDEHKIQSIQVFDINKIQYLNYSVANQEVTASKIAFSATGIDNGELMNISINTEETMQYGESSIQIGSVNEQTACYIGNWPQNSPK